MAMDGTLARGIMENKLSSEGSPECTARQDSNGTPGNPVASLGLRTGILDPYDLGMRGGL
jgi:hypothetical protein